MNDDGTFDRMEAASNLREIANFMEAGASAAQAANRLKAITRSLQFLCTCNENQCCLPHQAHIAPHKGCMLR